VYSGLENVVDIIDDAQEMNEMRERYEKRVSDSFVTF
jgi:hypothetical protein